MRRSNAISMTTISILACILAIPAQAGGGGFSSSICDSDTLLSVNRTTYHYEAGHLYDGSYKQVLAYVAQRTQGDDFKKSCNENIESVKDLPNAEDLIDGIINANRESCKRACNDAAGNYVYGQSCVEVCHNLGTLRSAAAHAALIARQDAKASANCTAQTGAINGSNIATVTTKAAGTDPLPASLVVDTKAIAAAGAAVKP